MNQYTKEEKNRANIILFGLIGVICFGIYHFVQQPIEFIVPVINAPVSLDSITLMFIFGFVCAIFWSKIVEFILRLQFNVGSEKELADPQEKFREYIETKGSPFFKHPEYVDGNWVQKDDFKFIKDGQYAFVYWFENIYTGLITPLNHNYIVFVNAYKNEPLRPAVSPIKRYEDYNYTYDEMKARARQGSKEPTNIFDIIESDPEFRENLNLRDIAPFVDKGENE